MLRTHGPILLLCTLFAGCSSEAKAHLDPDMPSVLIVAIDGLRPDQVGSFGAPGGGVTPTLDELAVRGVIYTDAITPAPWSAPALASILSGCNPSTLGWTDLETPLPYAAVLLAERLDQHVSGAVVSHRFVDASTHLDQGCGHYESVGVPPLDAGEDHVPKAAAERVVDAGLTFIDGTGSAPFFLVLHIADPMPPWDVIGHRVAEDYDGPVRAGQPLPELLRLASRMNGADRVAIEALHDEAVERVDRELGRLVKGLEQRGRLSNTYLCIVGSLGAERGEHGELGTSMRLYDELLHVPWILTGPRLSRAEVNAPVSLIDVAPTLLSLVEVEADGMDGRPALPGVEAAPRFLVSETDRARSLRAALWDRWKLIHDHETGQSELYDLLEDPGELRDLSDIQPDRVRELEAALDEWEALRAE